MKIVMGCIGLLLVIFCGAYLFLRLGLLSFRADETPGAFEQKFAMQIVDSSTNRHASQTKNPLQPTEANVLAGLKVYESSCAGCHGDPTLSRSPMAHAFYPPAPQFLDDPADMPDNENFYIIKHGIRWTGMPAWGNILRDDDIWKLTVFLEQMQKLPPSADQIWKSGSARPPDAPK